VAALSVGAFVVLGVVANNMMIPHPQWMTIAGVRFRWHGWRHEWRRRERRADAAAVRDLIAHWSATARSPTLSRHHFPSPLSRCNVSSRRLPARHRFTCPLRRARIAAINAYLTDDAWRQPIAPFQIADHTWYIGTQGLSACWSARPRRGADRRRHAAGGGMLLRRMRELGVQPQDLKLILHSHAHGTTLARSRLSSVTGTPGQQCRIRCPARARQQ
jgi:hypothetical protein